MNHERPVSLYIVTRGGDKERLRPLVRLLLTMAMRQLMGVELTYKDGQPLMPHRHRLLMMLDEFPSLGRLQIIQDALPKCAGYGIKAFLAAQNREQMFNAYGQHQSITSNCHVRIVYAPNEWESAEWISRMIGNTTIVKEDVTESGTRFGSLKNVSRTYHEVSRPLLTPDEIMDLKKPRKDDSGQIVESGEMVVFVAGERPIFGTQILYFLDPVFGRRAMIEPPVTGSTRREPKRVSGRGVMNGNVVHPSRLHRRRAAIAVSITGALMMATLAAGEAAGLRINATASMPRGLWRVQAGDPIERGEIVTVCPPDQADIREAAHRGYIPNGGCPGGL